MYDKTTGNINAKASFQNSEPMNFAMRQPLIDAVASQAEAAEFQACKAARLRELQGLLLKNPDVARILDLLEEVRG